MVTESSVQRRPGVKVRGNDAGAFSRSKRYDVVLRSSGHTALRTPPQSATGSE